MMPVIRVSDATWERMKSYAKPFEDKPEDIVNLALDALDEKLGKKLERQTKTFLRPSHVKGKLPQKEFRKPLLQALLDLGGSADVSEIRKVMSRKVASLLSAADHEKVSTGEPRWWNAICWERADLVREGIFVKDGERGVWKLSDKGRAVAQSL